MDRHYYMHYLYIYYPIYLIVGTNFHGDES